MLVRGMYQPHRVITARQFKELQTSRGVIIYYYISIALTGAIVLGVEVLSSRILTPYFGVSLYIWASILTVTLLCLAVGYFLGGKLVKSRGDEEVKRCFILFVGLASIALSLSAYSYPFIFPVLMGIHLVAGSLIASVILMAVPLVLFSALNPIVMILVRSNEIAKGDAGAGLVFFVSTLGSVLGVITTAFLLIPLFSNTAGLLAYAFVAALTSLLGLLRLDRMRDTARRALSCSVVALVLSIGLLALELGFPKVKFVTAEGIVWNLLEERHSIFGTLKVVDRVDGDNSVRMYLTDGLIQDMVLPDGRSAVVFTYAISALLNQYAADARRLLFLGLGAGVVAQSFPSSSYRTDIVEINPNSLDIAKRHFGFDDTGRNVHVQDARTFVRNCGGRYDAVVVDLFHGDGVPDYLLSREFFEQIRRCGTDSVVVVMNLLIDKQDQRAKEVILATAASVFPEVGFFSDPDDPADVRNAFIVASNHPPPYSNARVAVPAFLEAGLKGVLRSGRRVDGTDFVATLPLSDDHNTYSIVSADMSMRVRRMLQGLLPAYLYKS